jgi:hypothetical protein
VSLDPTACNCESFDEESFDALLDIIEVMCKIFAMSATAVACVEYVWSCRFPITTDLCNGMKVAGNSSAWQLGLVPPRKSEYESELRLAINWPRCLMRQNRQS